MQRFTSAQTSINKAKLPAVYKKADITGMVMDYGCGRYTDHIRAHVHRNGGEFLPYDPYNQTYATNANTMDEVVKAIRNRQPITIICSNVLNVIDDDEAVKKIADRIEYIVKATGGKAFITVYEGNKSGVGRQTGADQYQRNQPLDFYRKFFRNAVIEKQMIVVRTEA